MVSEFEKGLHLPERLPSTLSPTTAPGAHLRLSKACPLLGSLKLNSECRTVQNTSGDGETQVSAGPVLTSFRLQWPSKGWCREWLLQISNVLG